MRGFSHLQQESPLKRVCSTIGCLEFQESAEGLYDRGFIKADAHFCCVSKMSFHAGPVPALVTVWAFPC